MSTGAPRIRFTPHATPVEDREAIFSAHDLPERSGVLDGTLGDITALPFIVEVDGVPMRGRTSPWVQEGWVLVFDTLKAGKSLRI